MKKEYVTPEVEICQLNRIDIICASGDDVELDYGGDNWTGDNVD